MGMFTKVFHIPMLVVSDTDMIIQLITLSLVSLLMFLIPATQILEFSFKYMLYLAGSTFHV